MELDERQTQSALGADSLKLAPQGVIGMKMKSNLILVCMFLIAAIGINFAIAKEAYTALTLRGAAQAQADWNFYLTLMLYGPAAGIISLLGLTILPLLEFGFSHIIRWMLILNVLFPFASYGIFKVLWP